MNNNKGFSLVIVSFIILSIFSLLAVVWKMGINDMVLAKRANEKSKAYYIAEGGIYYGGSIILEAVQASVEPQSSIIENTPFSEYKKSHSFELAITKEDPNYRVLSIGIYNGITQRVEALVSINGSDIIYSEMKKVSGQTLGTMDTTPPIITLNGSSTVTLTQGVSYIEQGATAIDDIDGDLTANIIIDSSEVDTSMVGTYTVYYSVTDSDGNTTTATRTVVVEASSGDTTPPGEVTGVSSTYDMSLASITLSWTNPIDSDLDDVNIYIGGSYVGSASKLISPLTGEESILPSFRYPSGNVLTTFVIKTVDTSGNESAGITYAHNP